MFFLSCNHARHPSDAGIPVLNPFQPSVCITSAKGDKGCEALRFVTSISKLAIRAVSLAVLEELSLHAPSSTAAPSVVAVKTLRILGLDSLCFKLFILPPNLVHCDGDLGYRVQPTVQSAIDV